MLSSGKSKRNSCCIFIILQVLTIFLSPSCSSSSSRVNLEPKSRFKKVENGNYAVDIGKMFKFSMINVGGLDIVDCNKKLILAIIWQLMRKYTLQVLAELGRHQGLAEVNDDHIVAWANARVSISHPFNMC